MNETPLRVQSPDKDVHSVAVTPHADAEGVYVETVVRTAQGEYVFQCAPEKFLMAGPAEAPREFRRGDVVRLRSGGPAMTVTRVIDRPGAKERARVGAPDGAQTLRLCFITDRGWHEVYGSSDLLTLSQE